MKHVLETYSDVVKQGNTEMESQKEVTAKSPSAVTHHQCVDDFIDFGSTPFSGDKSSDAGRAEIYARIVFSLFRLPASAALDMNTFILKLKLYCTYEGERYRVTGASRMGDIWLSKDFNRTSGYEKRVMVDQCSEWANTPNLEDSTASLAMEEGVIQYCKVFQAAGK